MTQSKQPSFTIELDDLDFNNENTITIGDVDSIDLNNTYGTTTSYWAGDSVADVTVTPSDGTFTLDINDYTSDSIDISNITSDWVFTNNSINPIEVESMCKEYPALEKVWRNFKSVYDMVQQDYKGKKEAGEIDDDIPF